ncbi:MAG TPA: PVC-type heme-binding CxxCH protein [Isosphaeraceae bacterium]|nr:PVC-type heme-binding CxxCH protein [Isosphaeraceae bacterium]
MPRNAFWLSIVMYLAGNGSLRADGPPAAKDTQKETVPLTAAEKAAASFELPEGFRATLFAGEPVVRQPIGIATDAKGRLWVAENDTYAEQAVNFDLTQRDRIVILEDDDHDGRADRRKVFWDDARRLTSAEPGPGGVWALCPPQLLFLPDRDGDDRMDGPPEVVLDGFDADRIRHNIANGLRWGPDGWLYGRHGITSSSLVGPPGTPPEKRERLNCSIWRYHPTRKVFEVVCRGTTNPWGMDWTERGEPFFINTVIGHLWQALPGAHYQRMFGEDFNPHLYALMPQTADHVHWDTAETWSDIRHLGVTPTTDKAGGGHAHSGFMIYLGDNWPAEYRGSAYTINLHGRRLNRDVLERKGAGYVARHAPDLLKTSDPWFRAVELLYGADGGVYIADWSDIGECHEADGVHRSSGRIYKITYGQPPRPAVADVAALDDAKLVDLTIHGPEWQSRKARVALQGRATDGKGMGAVHDALKSALDSESDPVRKLRVLWGLYVTGGTDEARLLKLLDEPDEHVRVWAIRLLVDGPTTSAASVRAFTAKAPDDPSGLVLLYLASALQRLAPADRWPLAERLAARGEYADDPAFPLMLWYGIEPAVPADPARALSLAGTSRIPSLTRFIARRLTSDIDRAPAGADALARAIRESKSAARTDELLNGMADALRGRRRVPAPASWSETRAALAKGSNEAARRLARELSILFGDAGALDEALAIAAAGGEPVDARREALRVAVGARALATIRLLRGLLHDRDLAADAARGLAAFNDPETPRALLDAFDRLPAAAKAEAIVTLTSRPTYARALLDAVVAGKVDRGQVPAFQVRQMLNFKDEDLRRRVAAIWAVSRAVPAEKRRQIAGWTERLDAKALAAADLGNGRRLFDRNCASCHTLFGQGGKVGPELTGAQRSSLAYILENVIDPSATVASSYRMATIALADGRVLNGIVGDRNGPTIAIQTPTERLLVPRSDIEEFRPSDLSLMPEGLLDPLQPDQVRDLIGYLMSPRQVPLPAGETGP